MLKKIRKNKDYDKNYYHKNRNKLLKQSGKRYSKKREEILEKAKKYNKKPEVFERRKVYNRTPKRAFVRIRNNAKSRNLEFSIKFEEFILFDGQPCSYCGNKMMSIGLDRVDNKKGYTIENVVPCCGLCNWMKKDLSGDKFIKHCKKICEN